jgi:hypothetical protein
MEAISPPVPLAWICGGASAILLRHATENLNFLRK